MRTRTSLPASITHFPYPLSGIQYHPATGTALAHLARYRVETGVSVEGEGCSDVP